MKISATEVVRNFSEILSAVTYRGAAYTAVRGGKPVAEIRPAGSPRQEPALADLPEILKRLPGFGKDAAFGNLILSRSSPTSRRLLKAIHENNSRYHCS